MAGRAEEIDLLLPDGSTKRVPAGTTPLQVAASIGSRLAREAVGALLDGEPVDLRAPLRSGGAFRIVTVRDPEAGPFVRHSAEHVLADAVKRLFPDAHYDAGRKDHSEKFQYDFRFPRAFTQDDLVRIEGVMNEILKEDLPFERIEISREEAARLFAEQGNDLKLERLRDIPAGETITIFRHGAFVDLCRGPHVQRTSQIGAVRLLEAAGSYFKGDETKERLQRIYGTAFSSREELATWERATAEARARDHRKLGPELDLFSFHPHAPASPFFHPRGAFVYNALVGYVRELNTRHGYGEVVTPQILDVELWKTSGHYENYRENMFFTEVEGREFAVKPMNCPTHCLIYQSARRSYRELPIRYADFGRLHRYERSGVTSGLTRVRSFAQDDAHVFCTEEQVQEEVLLAVGIILEIYRTFEFRDLEVAVGTRPERRVGRDEQWDRAEQALSRALDAAGSSYVLQPGDGAFYGPKIDFRVRDAIGRPWQLGTVQLDYQLPERFGLEYVAPDGGFARPVMIHRAMLGSIERFLGILIEHTAGLLPLWLAPVQVRVVPVSEKFLSYADQVAGFLETGGFRVEVDRSQEKLGHKIRDGELARVPYLAVVGGREQTEAAVALRARGRGDLGRFALEELAAKLREEVRSRAIVLAKETRIDYNRGEA